MSHVDSCIIGPMLAAFPPPTHLRGRPDAIERTLATYRLALEGYDRGTLERAWVKVSREHRFWNWPLLADVVKAAEAYRVPPDGAWVERTAALADAYTRRFMATTRAGVRSREAGYGAEMEGYVRACAWVQGQFIAGREGVGYESAVLFPGGGRDREAEAEWFSRQKVQAETGSIRVRVPLALVERWREGAAGGRSR